jgi:uncharacterized protein YqeY
VSDPGLKATIRADTVAALKAGEKIKVGALRMLTAAIVNKEKELRRELSDDEVREVAAKEVKKRTESIEAFESAGRQELADKEQAERQILRAYAPEQLSDEQVDALVEDAIASTGASGPQAMGKVMGVVMAGAKGKVDGSVVQAKVRARLGA